jgi:hypothetical protein
MPKLKFGMPFLQFGAASCDHAQRLSGPAPAAPPAGFTSGTEKWDGPFGLTIEDWDAGTYGADYSPPNRSWKFGSDIPAGWYTVIRRDTRRT